MRKIRSDRETIAQVMERLSGPISESGCIPWLGKIGTGGYAYVLYREGQKRLTRKAATVALELAGRPRPEGLEVSHTCANPACVNPEHLLWETHGENLARREWSPKGQRYVIDCKHCGQPKEQVISGDRMEWICKPCRAKRAEKWREQTGYDFNKYRAENKDRINAQRRARRNGSR